MTTPQYVYGGSATAITEGATTNAPRSITTPQYELPEPFGIWHQGATEEESDFFLYKDSGDVACGNCIKLYTHPAQPQEPPPECETEGEKRAYAFGWFKALEANRQPAADICPSCVTPLVCERDGTCLQEGQ